MTKNSDRFFLIIGSNWFGDSAADRARASATAVRRKSLDSRPENWESICRLLEEPKLLGAIVRLTAPNYRTMQSTPYQERARNLFRALGSTSHIVFVHESIITGDTSRHHFSNIFEFDQDSPFYQDNPFDQDSPFDKEDDYFEPPEPEVRSFVHELMTEHSINVVPYRTNAEMSILAQAFVEDNEKNLLFRVYVPSSRLYAAEGERLLALFRDWLNGAGKHSIRHDGYKTPAGQIYEFYGDDSLSRDGLSKEFDSFSKFLSSCSENPETAAATLTAKGMSRAAAESMVARYGKEGRRLELDIRQERESRLLGIRHSIEAELVDHGSSAALPWPEINYMLNSLVPEVGKLLPADLLSLPPATPYIPVSLTYNQQIINAVHGSVIQNIQGTASLGASPRELMALISEFGGAAATELESAVYELEDPDARTSDRLNARQKLKGFLMQLGGKVEGAALAALQSYLEAKMKSAF